MGTLSSELAPYVERLMPQPRIYADANVPAGLVGYMRAQLHWDVLFVLEDVFVKSLGTIRFKPKLFSCHLDLRNL